MYLTSYATQLVLHSQNGIFMSRHISACMGVRMCMRLCPGRRRSVRVLRIASTAASGAVVAVFLLLSLPRCCGLLCLENLDLTHNRA
jgi:hypothetical protein